MRSATLFAAASVSAMLANQACAQEGDAAAGEKIFARCKACHAVDDSNRVGPSLKGVIGRAAGTSPDYRYSPAMVEAGNSGVVWDDATLAAYIHQPRAVIKGTKMAFSGLKDDADVANVIAYLKQFP